MKKELDAVKAFHKAFGLTVNDTPTIPDFSIRNLRNNLHWEECREVEEELGPDEKKSAYSKKVLQLANRAFNELSFFLLPSSFREIARSPLPVIRTVENVFDLTDHLFTKEIPGHLLQDEELIKKGKPMKYIYRTFPITNEWERWSDVFTTKE